MDDKFSYFHSNLMMIQQLFFKMQQEMKCHFSSFECVCLINISAINLHVLSRFLKWWIINSHQCLIVLRSKKKKSSQLKWLNHLNFDRKGTQIVILQMRMTFKLQDTNFFLTLNNFCLLFDGVMIIPKTLKNGSFKLSMIVYSIFWNSMNQYMLSIYWNKLKHSFEKLFILYQMIFDSQRNKSWKRYQ